MTNPFSLVGAPPRYPVVQLSWSATGRLTGIRVSGRARPPYPRSHGHHTTASAVLMDTVRRQLIGGTLAEARVALTLLINRIHTPAEQARLTGARLDAFDDAATATRAALDRVGASPTGTPRNDLGLAIAAYLTCRNLAPLASAWMPGRRSTSAAEAAALAVLRRFESTGRRLPVAAPGEEPEDLLKHIWALVDDRPMVFALDGSGVDDITLPGRSDTGAEGVREIFVRHLREIARAYPLAYRESGLHTAVTFNKMWDDTELPGGQLMPDAPDPALLPPAPAATPAPIGWAPRSGDPAAQAVVRVDGNGDIEITALPLEGRGQTLLIKQNHHLTAEAAIVRSVRHAVVGQTVDLARDNLLALADAVEAFPTLPRDDDGEPALSLAVDPDRVFNQAWVAFATARENLRAHDAADVEGLLALITQTAAAYVRLRAAMPLAVMPHGSLPANKNEQRNAKLLDRWEAAPETAGPAEICGSLWGVLDLDRLATVFNGAPADDMPGAPPNRWDRVATVIMVHGLTVRAAWPAAFAMSGWATTGSLAYGLRLADIAVEPDRLAALAARLGFATDDLVAPVSRYVASEVQKDKTVSPDDEDMDDDMAYDPEEYEEIEDEKGVSRTDGGRKRRRDQSGT